MNECDIVFAMYDIGKSFAIVGTIICVTLLSISGILWINTWRRS